MKFILSILALSLMCQCSDTPKRERFPGPQGQTTDAQRASTEKAVLGGFDPLNNKFSKASQSTQHFIRAKISIANKVHIKPGMILYVSARRPEGGPPLAVQRMRSEEIHFPLTVELNEENAMIRDGSTFEGKIILTARLDQDGDPLSRQPGDAWGQKITSIKNQEEELLIDQVE